MSTKRKAAQPPKILYSHKVVERTPDWVITVLVVALVAVLSCVGLRSINVYSNDYTPLGYSHWQNTAIWNEEWVLVGFDGKIVGTVMKSDGLWHPQVAETPCSTSNVYTIGANGLYYQSNCARQLPQFDSFLNAKKALLSALETK